MRVEHVTLEETECFAPLFIDYINQKEQLQPFYNQFPTLPNFKSLIESRQLDPQIRRTLAEVLADQYGPLRMSEHTEFNIHSLTSDQTFTITTGHQLNIFTGPLYFIYKIATVIDACRQLKAKYPQYNFVPVYWMATEDHDVEEISSFNLFGRKFKWETTQKGPTGHLKPHSLNALIDELPERVPLFEKAYLDHDRLSDAVRFYVNELFGKEGLVVIDADDSRLKQFFRPVIEKELFENKSNELVQETSGKLEAAGYKTQAFSREINLFYMKPGLRSRIVREEETFKVLDTELTFTAEEIKKLVKTQPELFSPNVILRPLYQETILPNLAYVGGPAEIAYWMQLHDVFKHHDTFFPALMPRVFGMVINKVMGKKVDKLKLTNKQLFAPVHDLKAQYLAAHSENEYDLQEETAAMEKLFDQISKKAADIDPSLAGFIGAEASKTQKTLEGIAKRMKKAEEQNNETAMSQIDNIKEKLFPGNGLQERHDNFLNFYLNNHEFVNKVLKAFDAFGYTFHILREV